MSYTYKIEHYSAQESRLFVVFTNSNTALPPLGEWVFIPLGATEAQIINLINLAAPLKKWAATVSTVAQALVGRQLTGVAAIAAIPSTVEVSVAEIIKNNIVAETQKRLDAFAATRSYDSILSACTYATSSNTTFAKEGMCAVNAREATWSALYAVLAEVQSGQRAMPAGYADIEPLLPALSWLP